MAIVISRLQKNLAEDIVVLHFALSLGGIFESKC
jgi:hypothetical protein